MSVLCVKGKGHFVRVMLVFCSDYVHFLCGEKGHIDGYVVLLGLLLLLSCLQID
jgi:hypothetical protein